MEKLFDDFSGKCFFVYWASNFTSFLGVLTNESSAVLLVRTLDLL